jgi:hypothetical protein
MGRAQGGAGLRGNNFHIRALTAHIDDGHDGTRLHVPALHSCPPTLAALGANPPFSAHCKTTTTNHSSASPLCARRNPSLGHYRNAILA